MYAIMGITGNVGGEVARTLLAAGREVRAIVRNPDKAQAWAQKGCQIAVADINDEEALVAAFLGADGVSGDGAAKLRPCARLSRGIRDRRYFAFCAGTRTSQPSYLSLDHRR